MKNSKPQKAYNWLIEKSGQAKVEEFANFIYTLYEGKYTSKVLVSSFLNAGKVILEGEYIKINSMNAKTDTKISFGIEFEGGVIDNQGKQRQTSSDRVYAHNSKFSVHHDGTAGFEIISPVFTDAKEAAKDISDQWKYWKTMNPDLVPFFKCGYYHQSIGHHVHIGMPGKSFTSGQKKVLSTHFAKILPFMIALSNNSEGKIAGRNVLSKRALTSNYVRSLGGVIPISSDHYNEISDSSHGTVELRPFDANIPQIALSNAIIFQRIAKTVIDCKMDKIIFDEIEYKAEREKAIVSGFKNLKLNDYKAFLIKYFGDITFSDYPECFKEIVYLALKDKTAISEINKRVPKTDYYKVMTQNCDKYIDNLLTLKIPKGLRDRLSKAKLKLASINKFSDIAIEKTDINTAELANYIYGLLMQNKSMQEIENNLNENYKFDINIITQVKEVLQAKNQKEFDSIIFAGKTKFMIFNNNLKDSVIEMSLNEYNIRRINYSSIPARVVVQRIIEIFRENGQNYTNEQIIEMPERHYAFIVKNEICGVMKINSEANKLVDLFVDKKYSKFEEFIKDKLLDYLLQNHPGAN